MNHLLSHIVKELRTYGHDYAILTLAGVFFLTFLKLFQGDKSSTLVIIFFFIGFYVVWSIYHHSNSKTLHIRNVLEYVLIGATVLVFTLIVFSCN